MLECSLLTKRNCNHEIVSSVGLTIGRQGPNRGVVLRYLDNFMTQPHSVHETLRETSNQALIAETFTQRNCLAAFTFLCA